MLIYSKIEEKDGVEICQFPSVYLMNGWVLLVM